MGGAGWTTPRATAPAGVSSARRPAWRGTAAGWRSRSAGHRLHQEGVRSTPLQGPIGRRGVQHERNGCRLPVRIDHTVMTWETSWPALIRTTQHIGDWLLWDSRDVDVTRASNAIFASRHLLAGPILQGPYRGCARFRRPGEPKTLESNKSLADRDVSRSPHP